MAVDIVGVTLRWVGEKVIRSDDETVAFETDCGGKRGGEGRLEIGVVDLYELVETFFGIGVGVGYGEDVIG